MTDTTWQEQAVCATVDPEIFFPDPGRNDHVQQALSICKQCPVAALCLTTAITNRESYGIFGGATADQRARMVAKANRQQDAITRKQTRMRARTGPRCEHGTTNTGKNGTRVDGSQKWSCRTCRSARRTARRRVAA